MHSSKGYANTPLHNPFFPIFIKAALAQFSRLKRQSQHLIRSAVRCRWGAPCTIHAISGKSLYVRAFGSLHRFDSACRNGSRLACLQHARGVLCVGLGARAKDFTSLGHRIQGLYASSSIRGFCVVLTTRQTLPAESLQSHRYNYFGFARRTT